ncbi:MAG TPA: 3'-5' exonuclease [Bryobacteraceae bacterium]|nr:3'-5' exonuclease [Bryobacteraceae bacterium]
MSAPANNLNPEQRAVVESTLRPVLVMAPVGTGKTNVLALRAGRAIESGLAARSLLCLSFTNKAAREMKDRLTSLCGKLAAEITISTFHGLCASILRAEASTAGLDADFVIYDEEDSTQLISRLLAASGIHLGRKDADAVNFFLFEAAGKARLARYEEHRETPNEVYLKLLAQASFDAALLRQLKFPQWLASYVHELRENHAVDFTDLQLGVLHLFNEHPGVLDRWRRRFAWIQVDEVQDTSLSEYSILRNLAAEHRQLSFFGDIDQTIYEWRGSSPQVILERYRAEFEPLEIALVSNYRSTGAILEACGAVVRRCPGAVTQAIEAHSADMGDPVRVVQAPALEVEAEWIAGQIRQLRAASSNRWSDYTVLTRTNFKGRDISAVFSRLKIPHLQVDQQKFFQRAEIKAAMSVLKLILTPHDGNSLLRYLKTPPKGIGEATYNALCGAPRRAGLKVGDLLDERALEAGDPFAPLLGAFERGRVVVFDTETTGLDPYSDEIVEIAAARCGASGTAETFHEFLRPSRPVGDSEAIHGWSDAYLAENGQPPGQVLARFMEFCGDSILCGHNSQAYDIPILRASLDRAGLFPNGDFGPTFDTLDITRRFHRLPRYRLSQIAESLGLKSVPTHQAMDDVVTTVELLQRLALTLAEGAAERRQAVEAHRKLFTPLARMFTKWRGRLAFERPHELLARVVQESGLGRHFEDEADGEKRLMNLEELCRLLARYDNPELAPQAALVAALNLASLSGDIERQMQAEDRVPILTVHQSKGLEFDTVFVASATDDDFPSRRSRREGRLNEEHRLFYVAISRAKRRLFVTWHTRNDFGREQSPSRYISLLPPSTVYEKV